MHAIISCVLLCYFMLIHVTHFFLFMLHNCDLTALNINDMMYMITLTKYVILVITQYWYNLDCMLGLDVLLLWIVCMPHIISKDIFLYAGKKYHPLSCFYAHSLWGKNKNIKFGIWYRGFSKCQYILIYF